MTSTEYYTIIKHKETERKFHGKFLPKGNLHPTSKDIVEILVKLKDFEKFAKEKKEGKSKEEIIKQISESAETLIFKIKLPDIFSIKDYLKFIECETLEEMENYVEYIKYYGCELFIKSTEFDIVRINDLYDNVVGINCDDTKITKVPDFCKLCKNLRWFSCSNTRIKSIPKYMRKISTLISTGSLIEKKYPGIEYHHM